jgi:hypothetical protein
MLVALLCMMQAMMYAIPRYTAGLEMTAEIAALMIWAEMLLTIPVLLFCAGPFFQGAWRDLRLRRIGMDTPVALGIAVTFGASALALHRGEDVYFDSVTMFIGCCWWPAGCRPRPASDLPAAWRTRSPVCRSWSTGSTPTGRYARCRGASSSQVTVSCCPQARPFRRTVSSLPVRPPSTNRS